MENLFLYTLNFSKWANSIYVNYQQNNWLLDPSLPITRERLVKHRKKLWKSLENHKSENIHCDLRRFRNSCMLSIMTRDYLQLSNLEENLSSISHLAELCIQSAINHSIFIESKKYGVPKENSGEVAELFIFAMGKLGGYELNPASDVDLIFIHSDNGKTNPLVTDQEPIENSLFFSKVIRRFTNILSLNTSDGYVFKVDLRLRPNGDFGPNSISVDALEKYLFSNASNWERFAWIKSRIIYAPFFKSLKEFNKVSKQLNKLKSQFIYKPYLDFEVLSSLRMLNEKIKIQHQSSKEKKESNYFFNVKLESGGIRDIEFLVQVQQLVRGGRHKSLRFQSILKSLTELSRLDLISSKDKQIVLNTYKFWRALEHRVQYNLNSQCHTLKLNALEKLCESMKFKNTTELKRVVQDHKEKIISILNKSLNIKNKKTTALSFIKSSSNRNTYSSNVIHDNDLILYLQGKPTYSKMLDEYPHIVNKILKISSESVWISNYIKKHPSVLDELLKKTYVTNPIDFIKIKNDLHIQLDFQNEEFKKDTENQINILREVHHANLFRLLIQDFEKKWNIQELSEQLSNLADLIIDITLSCVIRSLNIDKELEPEIAVIAFGKLGGKELGFASDLDLIFLTNHLKENEHKIYFRIIKRFISWLSLSTSSGNLFNIDLRLRPNGNSGLLVTSLKSFSEYQLNKAWLWEHQAVSRSRFCGGNKEIGKEFERIRRTILEIERTPIDLMEEILSMREKITSSHNNSTNLFDLKYDKGGMVDIEFIVQVTVLRYSSIHKCFSKNIGNINLLYLFAEKKILPMSLTKKVAKIYASYRSEQHKLRLKGISSVRVKQEIFAEEKKYVNKLWDKVFVKAPKIIRKLSELNKAK